jgi:hypothetical protein
MAVHQGTAFVAGLRGKLGGGIIQTQPYGVVSRSGKVNQRKASLLQNPVTFTLATVAAVWRTLTPTQMASWATYASAYPTFTRFGVSRTPSPYQLYMKVNQCLLSKGQVPITTLSGPVTLSDITGATLTRVTPVGIQINWGFTGAGGEVYIIDSAPQSSVGRQMTNSYWRNNSVQTNISTGVTNITSAYIATYGQLLSGLNVWVRLRVLAQGNGQLGAPVYLSLKY